MNIIGTHLKAVITCLISQMLFYHTTIGQSFSSPVSNPFGLSPSSIIDFPSFADLDNDGDLDLMTGQLNGNLMYFKNTGTSNNPSYASPLSNPFGLSAAGMVTGPAFVDLDADGDFDLLISDDSGNMRYFRNDGNVSAPSYTLIGTNPFGLTNTGDLTSNVFADIDNDGDMDLFAGQDTYGSLDYFENTGSASIPQFASMQRNPFGLVSVEIVSFPSISDLDKDGDLDLLVCDNNGDFQYFENTGTSSNPQFASPQENLFGLTQTTPGPSALADLDGDNDADLFTCSFTDDMHYFENTSQTTSVPDFLNNLSIIVYPNPVIDMLTISTTVESNSGVVKLHSISGELLYENTLEKNTSIDMSGYSNGIYILKLNQGDGVVIEKIVKKQTN